MKINVIFTGTTTTCTYTHNLEWSEFPTRTVGELTLPGKAIVFWNGEFCRFNFTDYPHIHADNQEPEKMVRRHKGRFNAGDNALSIYERTDISNVVWDHISICGPLEYSGMNQKFVQLNLSMPRASNSLFVDARWPQSQRSYPRGPLELKMQSTIIELDAKSMKKWKDLLKELYDA